MCAGVSDELRRVNSGSMVYQLRCARLNPVRRSLLRLLYCMPAGNDASIHCDGDFMSMPFSVLSKSSIYEASLCTSLEVPASSLANSAESVMDDGTVQLMNGSLSIMFVSHWLSFFQFRLNPHRKLFSGSEPISTFDVSGFSESESSVPPNLKSSEKSYAQLSPSTVLRCMLNTVLLSSDTCTFVPASMMFWFRMVTVPEE